MKLKTQSSEKRKDNSKFSNIPFSTDSISPACKSNLLSAFPNYEKNILMVEQCGFQFQDTEYENGIIAATLHFVGLFKEQSEDQYNKVVIFNILSLTNFILAKESQQDESLYLETSDFQINIYVGPILQISRIIFRNYTLSTLSLPKSERITIYSYNPSLFPQIDIPFSISQIFQFRYAALCAQYGKAYDHSIVQYFHSLMKSQDPIFNLKHIPNSLDRQQILPIFQSLIYIPTIFGISCRNNDTPSIISDISPLVAKSAYIRSIKLMNCNSSSDLEVFSQAISSNNLLPLEELYLNDNEFEDLSPLINSFTSLQSKMTRLSLNDCGLDDSSLELLGNCLLNAQSLQNLNYLGIGGTEYSENSVKNIVKYIQGNNRLFSLDLSGSKNLLPILKSIPASSVNDLNLSDCTFDDESVSQLNYACQFLSTLNISRCNLSYIEVSDVISKVGKKQESLVSIKLNELNFSKERSFVILRGFLLTDLEKWKSIEMNDTQISSNELYAYQALFLRMTHLEHLSLNSNFKEEDAKNVASLFDIKSLKSISLANCQLASIIPNIIKSEVTKINLSNNDLNDQDALNLLSDPNITSIKLNDNSFKNFDNIVRVANENPHLNEPPLKHGLSTIRRISPYSKDFLNNISKFNIDHHTALNEDLKIPYPFVQKDHEEEVLELGNPSIYNLNKLNCVTIEINSPSQQLKSVDIYPNVDLSANSNIKIIHSSKKNKKNEPLSIPQKKENRYYNDSVEKSKKNNNFIIDSEDQSNSDDQSESKNNNINQYDSQYDNENQYDDYGQSNIDDQYDNQYDEDNLYDKDNQYDNDSQYSNEIEIRKPEIPNKKQKTDDVDDNNIMALLDSPAVEPTVRKQINQQNNVNYDVSSNSESVVQQNYHHNMPPQLEDDINSVSEDNIYSKPLVNNNNKNDNERSEIENSIVYSESEDVEIWLKKPENESQKEQLVTNDSKYSEEVVNSSSTMKSSSESPSPKSQKTGKSQKSKISNQFDEYDSDEIVKNQIKQASKISDKKKNLDKDEDFNNIDKNRNNFLNNLRRTLFSSENSDNEETEKVSSNSKKEVKSEATSNQNQNLFDFQENDDDYEEDEANMNPNLNERNQNRFQPPKNSKISSQVETEDSENDILNISEENSKQEIEDRIQKINKAGKSNNPVNDIVNDDYENQNEYEYDEQNELENEDYHQNSVNNNKSVKSKKNDQIDNNRITPSKPQKVSKIPTSIGGIQRRLNNEKESQNEMKENKEDEEITIEDEENSLPQKPRKRRSRIPSPFELHQTSPSNKRRKSDIVTDNTTNFKSKIPGPRSPQRTVNTNIQLQPENRQQQQLEEEEENDIRQVQKIPRKVLFESDEGNENDQNKNKSKENEEGSKLVDDDNNDDESRINNLSLSSNEEPIVHKKSRTILDRHPSLSEEEEAFIRMRRKKLPRKVLGQSDESENYNDTDAFSTASFSPQNSPPQIVNESPEKSKKKKRKSTDGKSKRLVYNENENENMLDVIEEKECFTIPKSPEPAAEESLNSAYDFVNLTSILFSMPKKKPHNNQLSPLILAFSPPFLEDEF